MTRASFTALGTPFALMYLLLPTTSATRSCACVAQEDAQEIAAAVITAVSNPMSRKPTECPMARSLAIRSHGYVQSISLLVNSRQSITRAPSASRPPEEGHVLQGR